MSDALIAGEQVQAPENPVAVAIEQSKLAYPLPVTAAPQEKLEEVEDIDFLLEEIENKIAPLALA